MLRIALLAAIAFASIPRGLAEPPAKPAPPPKPALKLTSIAPDKGDMDGGTYVVLKGERFLKDGPRNAKVYFGSRQGTVVRFQSDSELIVQAPGGKKDEVVDVLVIFDPGGQIKLSKAFTFVDKGNGPSIDDLPKK
jgi:hypothetical protein